MYSSLKLGVFSGVEIWPNFVDKDRFLRSNFAIKHVLFSFGRSAAGAARRVQRGGTENRTLDSGRLGLGRCFVICMFVANTEMTKARSSSLASGEYYQRAGCHHQKVKRILPSYRESKCNMGLHVCMRVDMNTNNGDILLLCTVLYGKQIRKIPKNPDFFHTIL